MINSMSVADEIKKLKELLDEGVLTDEEFEKQKNKLLDVGEDVSYDEFFNEYFLAFVCLYFFQNIFDKLIWYCSQPKKLSNIVVPIIGSMKRSIKLLKKEMQDSNVKYEDEFLEIFDEFLKEFEIQLPTATKGGLFPTGPFPKILEKSTSGKIDAINDKVGRSYFESDEWEDFCDEGLSVLFKKFKIPENYTEIT